jgi:serine/threonine protein phosphatase PrpC
VFPGRLSVSRTFGDIEAKRVRYGGNPNVIVCDPEIRVFKLQPNFDFFMIGCDGIFERLNNKQCVEAIWERINEQVHNQTIDNLSMHHMRQSNNNKKMGPSQRGKINYDEHVAAAEGVEIVLREAAASRSLDNITVLILGLKNLKTSIRKLNDG